MKLLHETDVRAETHRTKVRESLERIHRDLFSSYEVLSRQVYPDAHGKNALGMSEEEAAAALGEHAEDVRDIVAAVEALLDQLKPGSVEKGRRGHRKDGTAAASKPVLPAPHTAEAKSNAGDTKSNAGDPGSQLPPV